IALLDEVAFTHRDVLALRNEIFRRFELFVARFDDDAALVLVVLAEFDETVVFRQNRRLFRLACFEQFGHARQTARDVTCLGTFGRQTSENVARANRGTVFHRKNGIDGESVTRLAARRHFDRLVGLVDDHDGRTQLVAARTRTAAVHDNLVRDARLFVGHFLERDARHEFFVANRAFDFGEDRNGVRIPFRQAIAAFHRGAIVHLDACAIGDAVACAFRTLRIYNRDLHVATHGDHLAIGVFHDVAVHDLDLAVIRRLDLRLTRELRRAADVEGAHGELGARLADGLRRDDAGSLADVHGRAAGEIAPIALAADAVAEFARQHRTHAHLLDVRGLDLVGDVFGNLATALDDDFARIRVLDVFGRSTAEDAFGQRRHHLTAVDFGLNGDAVFGAAIFSSDDAVVRHVDETAGEITRVRRLERGVGQTLAGAVGGVEVLQHGEPFLEVGKDRRFDDRTVGTRHEAAHTGAAS